MPCFASLGKSSLLLAIFRIVEIEADGGIEIDGVDLGRDSSAPGVRIPLSSIRDRVIEECGLTFQPAEE